jgi:hypothetical protein
MILLLELENKILIAAKGTLVPPGELYVGWCSKKIGATLERQIWRRAFQGLLREARG